MKIIILGAGPAGLYAGLLLKKANPTHDITIIERNPADITYGWGVVFSDRTLASFQRADSKTYEQITTHFVIWNAIDVHYRDEIIRCGGHVIASISRKLLLHILQERCAELGVTLRFNCEISSLAELGDYDLLLAADGINSLVRKTYEPHFRPGIALGKARYIWLGADKVLDAFTFIFRENEHGLFQVHAYPFGGTTSTFIVECDETTWLRAGLDTATEQESLAYCQHLFANDLGNATLLSNNSKWISFPTLKTKTWHYQNMVLLGDAAHTAHFSIGSGTKLAMEDAIALASAIEQHPVLETALNEYELERKPVVEIFQNAAQESQAYFETLKRYLELEPIQFTFQLLTRSGRVSYDDLRLRDARFGEAIDRWYAQQASWYTQQVSRATTSIAPTLDEGIIDRALLPDQSSFTIAAPPPMLTSLRLRTCLFPNRIVLSPLSSCPAQDGMLDEGYGHLLRICALGGAGLVITELAAISHNGRISPADVGMYDMGHIAAWSKIVDDIHTHSSAKIALQLGHAGRRGSTQPRTKGMDRPLRQNGWPLLSASPMPYTPQSLVPKEMDRDDLDRVRDDFVQATRMAEEAGFDMLLLNFAHGYLLASFLSPLTNQRTDEYGGTREQRMRFPLEVFDAVYSIWSEEKPLAVALSVTDCVKEGATVEDAITIAKALKEHGCDIISIHTGQTTSNGEPGYTRGFLTPLSDRVRNEAGIPTLVGGYLTTTNEVNTILAAGRADLCILELPQMDS